MKKIKTLKLGNGRVREYFDLVIPLTEMQLVSYMGMPCKEYGKECIVCDAWAKWKKTGCVTVKADHDLMFKRLINGKV